MQVTDITVLLQHLKEHNLDNYNPGKKKTPDQSVKSFYTLNKGKQNKMCAFMNMYVNGNFA